MRAVSTPRTDGNDEDMPARRTVTTQKRDNAFFDAMARGETITAAMAAAGYNRSVYSRRERDKEFRQRWAEARQDAVERLEALVDQRAFVGVERPVMFQGERVDTVREFSDLLAIFRLKALAPDKYREQQHVEVTGAPLTLMALLAPMPQPPELSGLLDDD